MPLTMSGVSVWITTGTDKTPLEEYNQEVEDDNTVRCYIPSVASSHFQIQWEDNSTVSASLVACYMDGRPVGGVPSYPNTTGCNDGVRISARAVKPFCFSSIVTTDDEGVADPDGADPDLGCIQVELHRIRPRLRKDRRDRVHGQVQDVGPVHERSKKLSAHCVALGEEHVANKEGAFVTPSLLGDGPYAVFRFMYRPRELLLARGIIPPPGATHDTSPEMKPRMKLEEDVDRKPDVERDVKPDIKPVVQEKAQEPGLASSSMSNPQSRKTRSSSGPTMPRRHRLAARQRKILKDLKKQPKEEPADNVESSLKRSLRSWGRGRLS